jgi:hypothetical protein
MTNFQAVCLFMALCIAGPASADVPVLPVEGPGVAVFVGNIDAASVAAFIARNEHASIRRIIVQSPGGEIRQAMVLGNWILDRGVDVEVTGFCVSSCANYLLTAGRRKIIDAGAIVIWHGSARQKNLRVRADACPERIEALQRAHDGPSADGVDPLVIEKLTCDYFIAAIREQDAFFARSGVDEYITRMGQEPHDFKALWTVPVDVMARMGFGEVVALPDYGSAGYMKRFNKVDDPEPILVLGFDAEGGVVELAR